MKSRYFEIMKTEVQVFYRILCEDYEKNTAPNTSKLYTLLMVGLLFDGVFRKNGYKQKLRQIYMVRTHTIRFITHKDAVQ